MSQSKAGKAGLIYVDGIKKVEQTKEYAKEKGAQAKEYAKEKGVQAKEVISNGWASLKDTFKQNPLIQDQEGN